VADLENSDELIKKYKIMEPRGGADLINAEQKKVLKTFVEYIKEHNLSTNTVSRKTGVSVTTLYNIINLTKCTKKVFDILIKHYGDKL
jgi:DNA invertase Pin-like site-specific DNA recombinase